ncbi:hypothetical protein AAZX31_09G058300 [Glycine max]
MLKDHITKGLRKKFESTTQQKGPTIQNCYLESQSFPPSTSSFE